jgi:hypothetical protein
MKRLLTLTGVLLLLFYVTGVYGAGVEKKIYYEKKTTLSYPKKYTIRFSLWNDPTSTDQTSSMVWSEEKEVTLTTAKIRTYLGDTNSLDNVDFSEQLYVQVERKKADGTYVMIGTRDKFSVVPYALWSANAEAGGSGDITAVIAGTGLTGGGESGDVTLEVNTGVIQQRVTGNCPSGQYIRQINADGTVECGADANSGGDITSVTAGTGLTGGGTTGDVTLSIANEGVGTAQIADNAVSTTKIADGAVTSAKIADGAVTTDPMGLTLKRLQTERSLPRIFLTVR